MRGEARLGISERNGGQKDVAKKAGANLIAQGNESGIQRDGSLFVHPHHFLDLLLIFLLQTDCIQLKVQRGGDGQQTETRDSGGEKEKGSFS